MDCSLPGSSVHGISQTRILEWVAIPFSKGSESSRVKDENPSSADHEFLTRPHPGLPVFGCQGPGTQVLPPFLRPPPQKSLLSSNQQRTELNEAPSQPHQQQTLFLNIYLFSFDCAGSLLLGGFFSSCSKWVGGLLSTCDTWTSHCSGFSGCRAQALGCTGFSSCSVRLSRPGSLALDTGSTVVVRGLSCPEACVIFLDQGSNP